ncbi:MAG TPA: hypothetical protein PKY56_09465 [Candidatus Kapabacteria bacterium]|nr:hypothetical protein [Candidatus Kapabacteria bacterium]
MKKIIIYFVVFIYLIDLKVIASNYLDSSEIKELAEIIAIARFKFLITQESINRNYYLHVDSIENLNIENFTDSLDNNKGLNNEFYYDSLKVNKDLNEQMQEYIEKEQELFKDENTNNEKNNKPKDTNISKYEIDDEYFFNNKNDDFIKNIRKKINSLDNFLFNEKPNCIIENIPLSIEFKDSVKIFRIFLDAFTKYDFILKFPQLSYSDDTLILAINNQGNVFFLHNFEMEHQFEYFIEKYFFPIDTKEKADEVALLYLKANLNYANDRIVNSNNIALLQKKYKGNIEVSKKFDNKINKNHESNNKRFYIKYTCIDKNEANYNLFILREYTFTIISTGIESISISIKDVLNENN